MLSERSRLLLLLVLLLVVATAGWTTARADGKTGLPTVLSSSPASVSKPPAVPTSGEPDVGQTPRPLVTKDALLPAPRGEGGSSQGSPADLWFRWICRMWTIRYLGAR
jgi:hypothetical protein